MMLLHSVLGMLEMLVDGLLEIRDMESHAEANKTQERERDKRKRKNGLDLIVLKVI